MMKVAEYIMSFVAAQGTTDVFLISGGGNMYLLDAIGKNPKLKYFCNHHEQACAIAAEAYSRSSDKLGVCLVTTGPGGANTMTGVLGAWQDSIPVLYLSGQVKRDFMPQDGDGLRELGVQGADIISIVKSITKYAVTIKDAAKIRYHLEKACYLARTGRPGPVWLDIPLDIQATVIDETVLAGFDPVAEGFVQTNQDAEFHKISAVIDLLKTAERPVILAGHGIRLSKSETLFLEVVEKLQIPVVTSMGGTDVIPTDHPLFVGRPGAFGNRSGNFAIQNADLVISLGSRLHLWTIGYEYKAFAREAKKVVVDIDGAELKKKTINPDIAIQLDVKLFLSALNDHLKGVKPGVTDLWWQKCQEWKQRYPVVLPEYAQETDFVNSYFFTKVLSSVAADDEIIVTGNGTAFTGTIQAIDIKAGQRMHFNVGCASMGYDLPAAIGVAVAHPGKRIVLITGDGSLMMNLQELQTIAHHKLPIKIFLLNNKGYLAIMNTQNALMAGNFVGAEASSGVSFPDFKKVADAFSLPYTYIKDHTNLMENVAAVLASDGPMFCELNMRKGQPLVPKVSSKKLDDGKLVSKPLEDMYPFLDREEFLSNMFVKPLNAD